MLAGAAADERFPKNESSVGALAGRKLEEMLSDCVVAGRQGSMVLLPKVNAGGPDTSPLGAVFDPAGGDVTVAAHSGLVRVTDCSPLLETPVPNIGAAAAGADAGNAVKPNDPVSRAVTPLEARPVPDPGALLAANKGVNRGITGGELAGKKLWGVGAARTGGR